jgi:hypothetical protein
MGSHMFQNSRGLLIWDHGQYQFDCYDACITMSLVGMMGLVARY